MMNISTGFKPNTLILIKVIKSNATVVTPKLDDDEEREYFTKIELSDVGIDFLWRY